MSRKYNDLTGEVVGRLTALAAMQPTGKHAGLNWLCLCECGEHTSVAASNLRAPNKPSKSCGCLRRQYHSLRPFEHVFNRLKSIFERERHKDTSKLTYEEFLEFTKIKNCHYCEAPIRWAVHVVKGESNSYNLDRKDSTVGYFKDNLVVCCKRCNYAKGYWFTYEQFLELGKTIRKLQ